MDLQLAKSMANQAIWEHGLSALGWTFKFDNAKNRGGNCHYGTKTISLSRYITGAAETEDIRLIILHEVAHALCPVGANHGPTWRRKLLEIGGDGHRTHALQTAPARYVGTCPGCGTEVKRHRRPKHAQSCAKCSRTFDARFIITWTDTLTSTRTGR